MRVLVLVLVLVGALRGRVDDPDDAKTCTSTSAEGRCQSWRFYHRWKADEVGDGFVIGKLPADAPFFASASKLSRLLDLSTQSPFEPSSGTDGRRSTFLFHGSVTSRGHNILLTPVSEKV